jgi:hypothetical protein
MLSEATDALVWVWKTYKASRDDLVPLATFAAATVAAWVALGQLRVARLRHEEQTKADLQRRITESFAKAVEQLSSDRLQVRLGGVYTLARIARESDADYWPVMETLTAFVRERRPAPRTAHEAPGSAMRPPDERLPLDVVAVLAVIARRGERERTLEGQQSWRVDLTFADLSGADLRGMHLRGALLQGAHLRGADLQGADLSGAHLYDAHLQGSDLTGAGLGGTTLRGARLRGALLCDAQLEHARLDGADLDGVNLRGARLHGARLSAAAGLTQDQIDEALGDAATILPNGLRRPRGW